jgi:hypothetical protein
MAAQFAASIARLPDPALNAFQRREFPIVVHEPVHVSMYGSNRCRPRFVAPRRTASLAEIGGVIPPQSFEISGEILITVMLRQELCQVSASVRKQSLVNEVKRCGGAFYIQQQSANLCGVNNRSQDLLNGKRRENKLGRGRWVGKPDLSHCPYTPVSIRQGPGRDEWPGSSGRRRD